MSEKVTYTQIQNYLKEHPDDLERLVLEAIPDTKGAVSLAGHKLQLVSEKLALAEQQIHEFIDVSTQNQTLFQLCHQLVQQLQKPQSIQAATARLGEILKATLDTRDYHLFIFQDKAEPDCTATSFVSQANFQTAVGGYLILINPLWVSCGQKNQSAFSRTWIMTFHPARLFRSSVKTSSARSPLAAKTAMASIAIRTPCSFNLSATS